MSRILVTGGGGFIGSHLVERLLERGDDVRVLDNFSSGRRENLTPFLDDIEVVEGDIRSYERAATGVRGCDAVMHQAALPSVPRSVQDPLTSHEVNTTGTLNILLAARDHQVERVVFASSSSVYGANPEIPKREAMATLPLSPYGVAKQTAESYCRSFFHVYGLPTVALRYFNVFGPRQDPLSQYAAVIPNFITAMLEGRSPIVHGDGLQSRDFTYIDNVADANLLALTARDVGGRTFNVACGERIGILDVIDHLNALLGTDIVPEHTDTRPGDVRDSHASLDDVRDGLGFVPAVPFRDGLSRTVEHFRALGARTTAAAR